MLEKLITQIELDTSAETKKWLVQAKAGDKATRYVSVLIVNDGQEYIPPEDADIIANFKKPDGHWCYNHCTKDPNSNRILIELTSQALAADGLLRCEVEIRSADSSQILTTCQFDVNVGPTLRNEDAILSSNEMTAFDVKWAAIAKDTELWRTAETLRVENETARAQAEEDRAAAEALRTQAEQNRQTAEQSRAEAETARTQAEEARAAAEPLRAQAETARAQAEEDRAAAEALRTQAEQNRQTAEQSRAEAETVRTQAEQGRETNTQTAINNVNTATQDAQRLIEAAAANETIDSLFAAQLNGSNTDDVFTRWWATAAPSGQTLTELLGRWFNLIRDEHTYGVKFYRYDVDATTEGIMIQHSATLGRCKPGTNTTPAVDPYRNTPAFWTREVAYEIENKDVVIKAVAGIGGVSREELLTGKYGMVGVAQKTGWVRDTEDETYLIHEYHCGPANYLKEPGFVPLPEAIRVDGTLRPFIVHAKYMAGRGADGKLTSASGLAAVNHISQQNQITEWRKRGADYSGMSGCDNAFRMRMVWYKYGMKGNSGTLEGCTGYSFQHKAAVSETGVKRVILTSSQAGAVVVGSTVSVGVPRASDGSTDRYYDEMNKDANMVRVLSIEDVTIGGTGYKAVNLETDTPFDTVANTTIMSSMPWRSGSCDNVQGVDGSPSSPTGGKEPYIIQGLESQLGAYIVIADQLIVQKNDGTYTHQVAFFREAAKITSSATTAFLSATVLTLPQDTTNSWQYIEDVSIDRDGNMYPTAIGRASSSTGCRASMYVLSPGARVYAFWAWAALSYWSRCGLACVGSINSVGNEGWRGLAGACGSGANRGEYTAV